GNVKFSDDYVLRDTIPNAIQGSYHVFDAAVSVSSPDQGWKLSLIGKNLNDEYIQTYASDTPSTGGNAGSIYGFQADRYSYMKPGRTMMLELSYQR
ncbi:MAG: TonB-dependent receptor, partial [Pseudomonadota bacterium]|nr:TonB-dependent receptor [Pseudomonadota bacterium]